VSNPEEPINATASDNKEETEIFYKRFKDDLKRRSMPMTCLLFGIGTTFHWGFQLAQV
jgi:hypothetical protein